MLRVGLTGGIGSGKSTVAQRLVAHGAVLVDSDTLAREVVAPGSGGLAEVVATFGEDVLDPEGALDRAALAAVVFGDPAARERLNAIVHPRVRQRSAELIAALASDSVVVQDVPLLVEGRMAPLFPLVVVVHADAEERVRRLVRHRGMPEPDARARIAAQADDTARRAAADVWLDNAGSPADLDEAVDLLWSDRLVPFEENLRRRRPVRTASRIVEPDPCWADDGRRLGARVAAAVGERGRGVAHTGPTAVAGLPAPDVVELQLGVASRADADGVRDALADIGFPRCDGDSQPGAERVHGGADPGRAVRVDVREVGSPGWRRALLVGDWLRVDEAARAEYRARAMGGGPEPASRADEDPVAVAMPPGADAWAAATGWTPPSDGPTER